jgi:hypothetical protein
MPEGFPGDSVATPRVSTLPETAAYDYEKSVSTYQHLCDRLPHSRWRIKYLIYKGVVGGPDRDRTDDLFHAMKCRARLLLKDKDL